MKLLSTLPKGDGNGLVGLDPVVVAEKDFRHVVIAIISAKKVVEDTETGDTEVAMRIDRIERILPVDAEAAEAMLRRSLQKRIGVAQLPVEPVEDDIRSAFRDALMDIDLPDGVTVTFQAAGESKDEEQ
jgi:hypothetical protein